MSSWGRPMRAMVDSKSATAFSTWEERSFSSLKMAVWWYLACIAGLAAGRLLCFSLFISMILEVRESKEKKSEKKKKKKNKTKNEPQGCEKRDSSLLLLERCGILLICRKSTSEIKILQFVHLGDKKREKKSKSLFFSLTP